MTLQQLKTEGTVLPTIPPGTRVTIRQWAKNTYNDISSSKENFISYGVEEINGGLHIKVEVKDYSSDLHYLIPIEEFSKFMTIEEEELFGIQFQCAGKGIVYKIGSMYNKHHVVTWTNDKADQCNTTGYTVDQIQKYFNNGTWIKINNMKRVIGYKTAIDLFGGVIKKGTVYTKIGTNTMNPYNEINDKSGSTGLPAEIVETWEPVYEEEKPKFLSIQIGSKDTVVTVNKNGKIDFRGEYTAIVLVKALVKDFDIEPRVIGSNWETSIDKTVRFIRIGCLSEDNLFCINELNLIIDTYELLN